MDVGRCGETRGNNNTAFRSVHPQRRRSRKVFLRFPAVEENEDESEDEEGKFGRVQATRLYTAGKRYYI